LNDEKENTRRTEGVTAVRLEKSKLLALGITGYVYTK
jgi:hypothetical protein